jgi:aminoglycoside 3-N-acetyltransferase
MYAKISNKIEINKIDYFPFSTSIRELDINEGDILLVSSDILNLLIDLKYQENIIDPNYIIDNLQKIVGSEGTLLFPTYNWDFCRGFPFDYFKTPSMTGSLSSAALKRKDFKRTKHPIYSFAVWGQYQDLLYSMNNTDSFGIDSPFDFLYRQHGKNLIIDVDYQNCFTFAHYVEECVGVAYRYIKKFSAVYIDEQSKEEEKIFSMYVRNLEMETEHNSNPIGELLEDKGIAKRKQINNIPFIIVDLYHAFDVIKEDIINNSSRKLVVYKGQ